MARERTDVLVRMPGELKKRLADEVGRRGSNLNDVAVEILAARFGVDYDPTGRKGTPRGSGRDVLLRMPRALKDRLGQRASERRRTTNDLIVETLSERLGITSPRKERMASTNGTRNGAG